ncbi:NlpC/P60 family protein [Tepidamorphus gemmatus]|uniref:NlpC/P60 family protein n=1 Tax=Tepidamorphus gemmatus TaxID=747076 RepID=A0A4V2UYW7_9HYPH|nr:NlpC/P60 family protein [Tepidamorphus gemmatus]TCT08818.1 NlpC/P60 family protein [Tepidamorphus gemmatus]
MRSLDRRLHAWRADLADAALKGQVEAARFVVGTPARVRVAAAPLRREPRPDAPLDTEALYGESVRIFEETAEGWAWVQLDGDGYVGWCPTEALTRPGAPATHRVARLRTFVYPGPSIKLPPSMLLSTNALVAVLDIEGPFARTEDGFIWAGHLAPVAERMADWVAVADRFVGTPYLWGGRTSIGLDCSALVQVALVAAGIACPRDSDMQEAAFGLPTEAFDLDALTRGDLIFWKGHVAIARGDGTIVHASGHHMETVIEPAAAAVARIGKAGSAVTSVGRPR